MADEILAEQSYECGFPCIRSKPKLYFKKVMYDAVTPTKAHKTDAGYDLTIIEECKKFTEYVSLYDTGIAVIPEKGYYTEIIPRSSISRSGYMMANSVGVIDSDYRGTLKIALIKVDREMPDIKLPFRCAQLVMRKLHETDLEELVELDETERGEGGFGSTN